MRWQIPGNWNVPCFGGFDPRIWEEYCEQQKKAASETIFDSALGKTFKLKASGREFTVMSSVIDGKVEVEFSDDRLKTRYKYDAKDLEIATKK